MKTLAIIKMVIVGTSTGWNPRRLSSGKDRVTGFTIDSGLGKYLGTSIVYFRTSTGFGKLVTTRTSKKEVFKERRVG